MGFSIKFWLGMILLVTNQPLGWGGMFAFNALSINDRNLWYSLLGFGIYALSWGMMGLGVYLAGPEGVRYARSTLQRARSYIFSRRSGAADKPEK